MKLVARAAAQVKFVWKLEDLYGRRTDGATDSFLGGSCTQPDALITAANMCCTDSLACKCKVTKLAAQDRAVGEGSCFAGVSKSSRV